MPGSGKAEGVGVDSAMATFVALPLHSDTWRRAGDPSSVRTGKRLPRQATEGSVGLRPTPVYFFERSEVDALAPYHLTIRIQPRAGLFLRFLTKELIPTIRVQPVAMDYSSELSFDSQAPEDSARLLHAVRHGDHALFVRADEVEREWAVLQPALEGPPPPGFSATGSWGPANAEALIALRRWHLP